MNFTGNKENPHGVEAKQLMDANYIAQQNGKECMRSIVTQALEQVSLLF